jgi:hypothetical protein
MGRKIWCAMADAWKCDRRIDPVRGGRTLYVPSCSAITKVCRECFIKLVRGKYVERVEGVWIFRAYECDHQEKCRKVYDPNLRKVEGVCEKCFYDFLRNQWVLKCDAYTLGKWV